MACEAVEIPKGCHQASPSSPIKVQLRKASKLRRECNRHLRSGGRAPPAPLLLDRVLHPLDHIGRTFRWGRSRRSITADLGDPRQISSIV